MNTKLLKQKILDLAIHGKLVPQNPDDEPASQLLRRISEEKEKLIAQGKIKRPKKSDAVDAAQECPFEIPNSWEWVAVEDLFELNPKNKIDDETIVGFIPMELVSAGFGYSHTFQERKWSEVKKGYCHFQNGDIGIAKISPCFENRKSTIFNNLPNNCGAGTTELVILRGKVICTDFYLYVFQSEWYIKEGTKYFKGVVGQQRVHKNLFTTLQIPLPPLAEQQRIVSAIEKWFSLIDEIETNKESLQAAIKQTKSKVLDLAIKGKLVKKTDEWKMVTLGEIGKWQAGGTPSRGHKEYYGGEIPWLKTGDLNDGFITEIPEHITQLGLEKSSAKLNPKDSVLIAMYGATIGKVGILTFPAATNQACCACSEYKDVDKMYLFYFLLSHREIFISQGGGGAQPNISKDIIVKTTIPLPPLSEQTRIVSKIEEVFALLDEIERELA